MDFYITVTNGPSIDFPENRTPWCKHYLKENININGDYEVAVVQTVFKDVFPTSLATLHFFTNDEENSYIAVKMYAFDGESFEKIVKRLNDKLYDEFIKYYFRKNKTSYRNDQLKKVPKLIMNSQTFSIEIVAPDSWTFGLFDVDDGYIFNGQNHKEFLSEYFYHHRHFFLISDLVENQLTSEDPILTDIYLKDTKTNIVGEKIINPQYKKVNKKNFNSFFLQYATNLHSDIDFKGNITSTLHFRKINEF